jgi:hypothetical protein
MKIAYRGASCFLRVTKHHLGTKTGEDVIGGTHSTQGGEQKCMQDFGRENL